MKTKVALIVIYNHNFERNIEKIKKIYGSRFSTILQIMPFYRGDDPDVVGVYEASWQFNGYLTQALPHILRERDCSHYVFIGDDFILSPELNEWNFCEKMQLGEQDAYIDKMHLIDEESLNGATWPQYSFNKLLWSYNRTEFHRFLPSLEEARECCVRHGYDWKKGLPGYVLNSSLEETVRLNSKNINAFYKVRFLGSLAALCARVEIGFRKLFRCKVDEAAIKCKYNQMATKRKLTTDYHYPLFHGFADIMVIPAEKMEEFAHLCGVFAAARIFVETAVPTAYVLLMEHIKTAGDLPYEREIVWGEKQRDALVKAHDGSFAHLMANWPANVIYYHPVKLSQWKMDI